MRMSEALGVRGLLTVLALVVAAAAAAAQQAPPDPIVRENVTVKVSDHVYVIPDNSVGGVPNVGIIVGTRGMLVIDTGLGPRNGQTVLREAGKLGKPAELYIVTTHVHPEHDLGASAFPASAKMIRSQNQIRDIDEFGLQTAKTFASRTPLMAQLLEGATSARPTSRSTRSTGSTLAASACRSSRSAARTRAGTRRSSSRTTTCCSRAMS